LTEVRHRLGPLNDQAERAVTETLEIIRQRQASPFSAAIEGSFKSKNADLKEYLSWSDEQQSRYQSDAESTNSTWVENKMRELSVMWLIVVDGEIIAHGPALRTFPYEEDFDALCEKHGKYPFVFFSPRMFLIEETAAWHSTTVPVDAYPTIQIGLKANAAEIELEADFDTGALDTYLDLDRLVQQGVMSISPKNLRRLSSHLGKNFNYTTKSVWLELKDKNAQSHRIRINAICVENWQTSPFVAINPSRTALVGRDTMLQLQPLVLFNFADRQTQAEYLTS
jgi:hypothetical protein